ncbi:16S rRNA (uracil(1498)-N(3))-methyltransferase [Thermocrinis sp.]|uniref:RsmE family RNA methyltransferase n=1 Tax=Thermocrinis sp. TaxID=2024383 RepID=UPI00260845BD|nr:16S rRNA (uracil(1498)-N(3))-methyltransferase [Thermocrinis sp.]
MDRFIATKKIGNTLIIEGEELQHIFAKRIKVGQELELFFEDKLYLCFLEKLNKKSAFCIVIKELELTAPLPFITLYQCVPVELRTMDFIVEKVSEVGAYRLVPTLSKRSFQDIPTINKRMERWKRVAISAFKQCKRPKPLEIGHPTKLEELRADHDLNLLLDNFGGEKSPKDLNLKGVKTVSLVVGPEGGFTKQESELLRERGFIPIKLYPYILRSETAALLGVGLIMNLSTPS